MVSLYFGLPGSGKTTIAVKHIYDAVRKGLNVYTNIPVSIDGVYLISKDDLGKYDIHDGLVVLDEASLVYDSRDYKAFQLKDKEFNLLHRHARVDLEYFTQKYNGIDAKIRDICDAVYWVRKMPFRRSISKAVRVPYGVYIPDRKDTSNIGEILNGYYRPSFMDRLRSEKCKRKKYYKYFNSWDRPDLPPLPDKKRISSEVKVEKKKKITTLIKNKIRFGRHKTE